jgi:hypothetical protein
LVSLGALASLSLAVGCSSSGPKASTDKFVGTWAFTSGTVGGTCLGQNISNNLAPQTFTLAKGTTSDLLFTFGTCMVTLTVNGSQASADPAGQMCMFTFPFGGAPVMVNVLINTWTNDTTDGVTLTSAAAGTGSGGLADGCPFMLNGSATKTATPDGSAG